MIFVDWFVPGTQAGGPIRSVFSTVKLLGNDFDFKVFTRNTDHNSTQPYAGITPDEWVTFDEHTQVYYCSEQNLNSATIEKIISTVTFDKVYLNSFYSKWFSIVPLQVLAKRKEKHKVILAPRGMLGKGALQIKALKKKLFIAYSKLTGMHKGITWQASSESEKQDIEKVFGKQTSIKVVGNLSYIEQLSFTPRAKETGEIKLFFLSRVVPIKNLHTALEALKDISNHQVTYDVYGPLEDKLYHQKCLDLVKTLPSNIEVNFKGVLDNQNIQAVLQDYHVLLMPTLNENFGHSILESFCAGCPVIISDQTPWNNLQEKAVGYNVQVFAGKAQGEIVAAVNELAIMDKNTFNAMAERAYQYGLAYRLANNGIKLNRELFS